MKYKDIIKELITFSLPLILSGILQQLYSWADAFIVGHSGPEGELMLASIGATATITMLLVNTMTGFTVGLSILAAQEYGRKNTDTIRQIANIFLPILGILYAVFSVAMILCLHPVLRIMDTPVEILDYAYQYLRIILLGVPFLAVYNLFAALMRAMGNTKVAFYAVLLSSVLNVILDIIFVILLSFGVAGAAIATIISQITMTIFIVIYCKIKYPEILSKGQIQTKEVFKKGTSFGLPPMIQNSVTSMGSLVLQNFMNGFGASTVLAITTAYRVDSIMLLPVINLGSAISSMVARAKGEEDNEKIKNNLWSGLGLMIGISGVLALAMYLFGAAFVGFFGVTGEALQIGEEFFRDLSIFYVLFGVATVLRSVLEGMGDITYCSAIGITTLGIRIAFSYILKPVCAERAIAFAEGITWICLLLFMLIRVLYKSNKIFGRRHLE